MAQYGGEVKSVSIVGLAGQVDPDKVIRDESNIIRFIVNSDPNIPVDQKQLKISETLLKAKSLRELITSSLEAGEVIDPIAAFRAYETIRTLKKPMDDGANLHVNLRNLVERPGSFSESTSCEGQRTALANAFHALGIFAVERTDVVVVMQDRYEPGHISPDGQAGLDERFRVSLAPSAVAA